jgi:hypothetical protein
MTNPVARGLVPVGLRSGPETWDPGFIWHTTLNGFATAAQPNGDKSPRHRVVVIQLDRGGFIAGKPAPTGIA